MRGGWTVRASRAGMYIVDWMDYSLALVFHDAYWPENPYQDGGYGTYAETIGDWIFYSPAFENPPPKWLMSHEYVHIMEQDGLSGGIYWTLIYGCIKYGACADERAPTESIAYIWQGWTYLTGITSYATYHRPGYMFVP